MSHRAAIAFAAAILLATCGAGSRAARAQDSAAVARPWAEGIVVHGLVSTWYSYNGNQPAQRTNAFRVFDLDDDTFQVPVAELVVQRPAAAARDVGLRVDLAMGSSVPRVSAARGLFRDPVSGAAEDFDLQQAFLTYVVPGTAGPRIDAGKFVTCAGAEVIEGYDGWNDQATRSFLFGYAIPFTHTGARATWAVGSAGSIMGMIANGWDNATDDNRAKTVGAQLTLTPRPTLMVALSGMYGAEQPGHEGNHRRLADLVATWKLTPRFAIGLNADVADEEGLLANDARAGWSGIAGYARWQASDVFAIAARGEVFDDRDGVRTGIAQSLHELTLTPELRVNRSLVLRADIRDDRSSILAFPSDAGLERTQATVLLNALVPF
jgi:hypothetical protein